MENRKHTSTLRMAQLAILTAILLILAFTPLGYLKVGPLSITFLTLPVAIGAVLLGAKESLFLGAVFGLTSFFQCFGMDQLGVALMGVSPVKTAIMCILPRLLVGLLPGLIYHGLKNKQEKVGVALTCLSAPLINTIFFLGSLVLLFGKEPVITQFGNSVWAILSAMGIANVLLEAPVCLIVGTAICLALKKVVKPAPHSKGEEGQE